MQDTQGQDCACVISLAAQGGGCTILKAPNWKNFIADTADLTICLLLSFSPRSSPTVGKLQRTGGHQRPLLSSLYSPYSLSLEAEGKHKLRFLDTHQNSSGTAWLPPGSQLVECHLLTASRSLRVHLCLPNSSPLLSTEEMIQRSIVVWVKAHFLLYASLSLCL